LAYRMPFQSHKAVLSFWSEKGCYSSLGLCTTICRRSGSIPPPSPTPRYARLAAFHCFPLPLPLSAFSSPFPSPSGTFRLGARGDRPRSLRCSLSLARGRHRYTTASSILSARGRGGGRRLPWFYGAGIRHPSVIHPTGGPSEVTSWEMRGFDCFMHKEMYV
jgi:hypothetical protein